MQFNQPPYGNAPPFYNYFAPQFNTVYPEIVGEGDVTAVTLLDGTVRYIFTPAAKWWNPYQLNHNINYNTPNIASWYIRSISNPVPNPCHYPNPLNYVSQRCDYPVPCITDCSMNSFHLKLHNDASTSTTDLHYFFPKSRPCCYQVLLPAKENVTVQANIPTCRDTSVWCAPSKADKLCNVSPSLSTSESKRSVSFKRDKENVQCECKKKQSATMVDRGANTSERSQPQQGCSDQPCCSRDQNTSELWIPNSPLSRNAMQLF